MTEEIDSRGVACRCININLTKTENSNNSFECERMQLQCNTIAMYTEKRELRKNSTQNNSHRIVIISFSVYIQIT